MKLALEDVQRGMALLMEKHRKAVRNFERSNVLLELMERRFDEVCLICCAFQPCYVQSQKNNVYEKRFYELVDLVDGIFKEMGDQHAKDLEVCYFLIPYKQIYIFKHKNNSTYF